MAITSIPGFLTAETLLALVWTAFSIAAVFVIIRTAIRFRILHTLTIEDYWIFLALATLLTNDILQTVQLPYLYYLYGVTNGVVPLSDDFVSNGDNYVRFEFAIIGLFWTVLWCVKASFLSVYFKLFENVPTFRRWWYALAVFTFLAYVGCWIASFMSCQPINDYFKIGQCETKHDQMVSRFSVYYSTIVDILSDLMIMAMPIKLIYGVQISRKNKIALTGVFGLACVIIVFAIIRANQVLTAGGNVNLIMLELWSTLESSVAVVVGCLPAFKSLISGYGNSSQKTYWTYQGYPTGKSKRNDKSDLRHTSLPLESFNRPVISTNGRRAPSSESQEDMVDVDKANFIAVKDEVTISYLKPEDREAQGA